MKRMKKINLTEALALWLEEQARKTGLSESDIARRALEQYKEVMDAGTSK